MANPTRNEQLDDLYTTTWNNRSKTEVEQIFDATPFYYWLRRRGGIQFDGTGGRYLEIPLAYAKNDTVTSLGRGSTISIADTSFLTVAQYEWKFVAGSIVRYFTDDAKNKSKQQHMNLVNSKIGNLRMSLIDKFEEYFFDDGTGNGSKDPEGLGNLVDATPDTARTVGNIAQTTYTWWKNRQKASTGAASVYLVTDMRNLYNTCSKGQRVEAPTIAVTDQTTYELYEDEVVEQKQIVNKIFGDAEFEYVNFKGKPVIWSAQCTAGYIYFLNDRYISLKIDPAINFQPTEWKNIPNQLDRVMQIVCKLNLVASRRKSLGVLTGNAA